MAIARNGRVRLRYLDTGTRDGTPVLHIMGLGASARAWSRLLPQVEAGHRALTFDHRGTGRSDPVTFPLSMDDLVGDVLAVLDAARVGSAHVHGVSLGGMVAQELALRHPDRVRSLILASTTPGGFIASEPPWKLLAAAGLRPFVGAARAKGLLHEALYSAQTLARFPELVAQDEEVRAQDATPPATVAAQVLAVAGHDTRRRLRELDGLPVTVVHGTRDTIIAPRAGELLHEGIPGSQLVLIAGAGHMLGTDAPGAWAHAVLEHLRRAEAS